jgi:hypothetical protein
MTNSMARATSWWGTVRNVRQTLQSRPSKASHLSLTFPLGLNSVDNFVGNLKFVSQMKRITVEKKKLRKKKQHGGMLHKILARGYPTNIGLLAGASCIISVIFLLFSRQKFNLSTF